MSDNTKFAVLVAVAGAALYVMRNGIDSVNAALPEELPADMSDLPSEIRTFDPISFAGEVGISDNGVVYDDPEQGPMNDEPGDDQNVTFEEVNSNNTTADDTDPTTYAPDVQDGSTAPDGGHLADAGDSQNWGSAGEQENDDLTERAADSNMTDDVKSAFDRLANADDPSNL
jgi:hypothetical protein